MRKGEGRGGGRRQEGKERNSCRSYNLNGLRDLSVIKINRLIAVTKSSITKFTWFSKEDNKAKKHGNSN